MTNDFRPIQLAFPRQKIEREWYSEQVCDDNPMAVEVAEPLFTAGIRTAAITERIGYHTDPDYHISSRVYHIFTMLLQGQMAMEVGSKTHDMEPGDLVFNPAHTPFRRQGKKNGKLWFLYIEIFDKPFWEPLKANGPFVRNYEFGDQMFLLLRRILDSHRTRSNIQLARANAQALLALLRHEVTSLARPSDKHRKDLGRLVEAIRQHPEKEWKTTEMAARLRISRATLTRLFQREYGMPPKVMVIRQRIAVACEMLVRTDATIESIAASVGYHSPYTFSDLFREYTRLRPGAYREKFRR